MRIFLIALMMWTSLLMQGQQITTAGWHEIDSLFQTAYKNDEPGASIAVVKKGKVIFQNSYGVTDLVTRTKIGSNTNFNIGSVTKQFTAMAILQLSEKK